jgi:hypothetical protein
MMRPWEETTIRAFITPSRRIRWLDSIASLDRRSRFLDRLNHCCDLDARFTTILPSNTEIIRLLKQHGAAESCHLISAAASLDGLELPLAEAVSEVDQSGWATIVCCVPGRLAYYHDECGERRVLLERKS